MRRQQGQVLNGEGAGDAGGGGSRGAGGAGGAEGAGRHESEGDQDSTRAVARCAVWGSPVAHSLSPVLHRAAYLSLGLDGWTYDRREVDEDAFADALAALGATWRGLSLTMPLKEAALAAAVQSSATARAAGGANTLVREATGWSAHNTDVKGIRAALADHGATTVEHAVVIGAGATARSALLALAGAGLARVTFMVRADVRPETRALADSLGVGVDSVALGDWPGDTDAIVSTVPPASLAATAPPPAVSSRVRPHALLDVVYGGGTTPLQAGGAGRGWTIVPGTDMLLHQAGAQVRLMTGREAPLRAMRDALDAALGDAPGDRDDALSTAPETALARRAPGHGSSTRA